MSQDALQQDTLRDDVEAVDEIAEQCRRERADLDPDAKASPGGSITWRRVPTGLIRHLRSARAERRRLRRADATSPSRHPPRTHPDRTGQASHDDVRWHDGSVGPTRAQRPRQAGTQPVRSARQPGSARRRRPRCDRPSDDPARHHRTAPRRCLGRRRSSTTSCAAAQVPARCRRRSGRDARTDFALEWLRALVDHGCNLPGRASRRANDAPMANVQSACSST